MKTVFGICLALAFSIPAHAESSCVPASGPKADIEAQHGRWIYLTTDQWEFLRGIYFVNRGTPPGMPAGDRAVLAQVEGDDSGVIFFVDDGMVCGAMKISGALVTALLEVDASNVVHNGAPL